MSEVGDFRPGAWALALSTRILETVILPASPDGRDLAPRLAAVTGRPLLAGCTEVTETTATLWPASGVESWIPSPLALPVVATLQPGDPFGCTR